MVGIEIFGIYPKKFCTLDHKTYSYKKSTVT